MLTWDIPSPPACTQRTIEGALPAEEGFAVMAIILIGRRRPIALTTLGDSIEELDPSYENATLAVEVSLDEEQDEAGGRGGGLTGAVRDDVNRTASSLSSRLESRPRRKPCAPRLSQKPTPPRCSRAFLL